MSLLTVAAIISLLLFIIAGGLMMHAAARPPMAMRTESGRSPAEHAFRRHKAALRQGSLVCMVAGAVNIAAGAFLAAISVPTN